MPLKLKIVDPYELILGDTMIFRMPFPLIVYREEIRLVKYNDNKKEREYKVNRPVD